MNEKDARASERAKRGASRPRPRPRARGRGRGRGRGRTLLRHSTELTSISSMRSTSSLIFASARRRCRARECRLLGFCSSTTRVVLMTTARSKYDKSSFTSVSCAPRPRRPPRREDGQARTRVPVLHMRALPSIRGGRSLRRLRVRVVGRASRFTFVCSSFTTSFRSPLARSDRRAAPPVASRRVIASRRPSQASTPRARSRRERPARRRVPVRDPPGVSLPRHVRPQRARGRASRGGRRGRLELRPRLAVPSPERVQLPRALARADARCERRRRGE